MALSSAQVSRFTRQIVLPAVGAAGQEKLCRATVVLGELHPAAQVAAMYLVAAGVPELTFSDTAGVVSAPGPLFQLEDVGRPAADAAFHRLVELGLGTFAVPSPGDVPLDIPRARDQVEAMAIGADMARKVILELVA